MRVKKNIVWRRVAALLLICGLLFPAAPAVQARRLDVERGKITVYQYDWVNSYEELMSPDVFPQNQWVDILLAWDNTSSDKSWGDGKIWYAGAAKNSSGKETYKGNNEFDVDNYDYDFFSYKADPSWYIGGDSKIPTDADSFFSQDKLGHMQMKRVGLDENDNNRAKTDLGRMYSPIFHMSLLDERGKALYFGRERAYGRDGTYWISNRLIDQEDVEDRYEAYDLTVQMFAESDKKNQANYRYGTVNIFANVTAFLFGADDPYFKHKSNSLRIEEDDNKNAWDRTFRIYVRTAREFDIFMDDIEVSDGWSFRIDEDVMLDDDATITVKDGGVMVVNSHLILNGKVVVEEGGTVIINEGATVSPYYNSAEDSGSFDIRGGNVVVLDGGKLVADEEDSYIYISRGGSLVNRGLVVVQSMNLSDSSRFLNEEGAQLAMGFSTEESRASLKSDSIAQVIDRLTDHGNYDMVVGRLNISGKSQLVNRGEARVFQQSVSGGLTNRVVSATRTAGTVCGNEENGTLIGAFGYAEKGEGVAVRFRTWPCGWPDTVLPTG